MSTVSSKTKANRGSQAPRKRTKVTHPRRAPGVEHKFYDTGAINLFPVKDGTMSDGEVNPTATQLISTPPQGDAAQHRDGKKIIIDTIVIAGIVRWASHAIEDSFGARVPRMYIALVQDTQTNGATFDTENAFSNQTGDDLMCVAPLKNLYNATRFKTLKVWNVERFAMPSVVSNSGEGNIFYLPVQTNKFECYLKVDIPVNFNSTTTNTVSAVVDNSLHMVAWQDTSDVAMRGDISYNARIRFIG